MPWPAKACWAIGQRLPAPARTLGPTAAPRTVFTGLGLVDRQLPALELGAVEVGDGLVGPALHLDEGEAARPARLAILDDLGRGHGAVLPERLAEVVGGRAEGKVSDVQFLTHANPLGPCGPDKSYGTHSRQGRRGKKSKRGPGLSAAPSRPSRPSRQTGRGIEGTARILSTTAAV